MKQIRRNTQPFLGHTNVHRGFIGILLLMLWVLIAGCSNPVNNGGDTAAPPTEKWATAFGLDGFSYENLNAVHAANDNGYVLAGRTSADDKDVLIIKIDKSGYSEWNRRIDALNADEGLEVFQGPDNDIIVAGSSEYDSSSTALLLVRLSASGNLMGSMALDMSSGREAPTGLGYHDNKFVVTGYEDANNTGFLLTFNDLDSDLNDLSLVSLDSARVTGLTVADGKYLLPFKTDTLGSWDAGLIVSNGSNPQSVIFGTMSSSPSGPDSFTSVRPTPDGGYLTTGTTESFGSGGKDIWVTKLDASLNPEWQKVYGGPDDETAVSLVKAANGYLVLGSTASFGAGGKDVLALHLEGDGSVVRERTYGGSDGDVAEAAVQGVHGGVLITGSTYSYGPGKLDFLAFKTDDALDITPERLQSESNVTVIATNVSVTTSSPSGGSGSASIVDTSGLTSVEATIISDRQ